MIEFSDKVNLFFCIIIILVLVSIFSYDYGIKHGIEEHKLKAVDVGHARYIVNNEGCVSFEWLATQTAKVNNER